MPVKWGFQKRFQLQAARCRLALFRQSVDKKHPSPAPSCLSWVLLSSAHANTSGIRCCSKFFLLLKPALLWTVLYNACNKLQRQVSAVTTQPVVQCVQQTAETSVSCDCTTCCTMRATNSWYKCQLWLHKMLLNACNKLLRQVSAVTAQNVVKCVQQTAETSVSCDCTKCC